METSEWFHAGSSHVLQSRDDSALSAIDQKRLGCIPLPTISGLQGRHQFGVRAFLKIGDRARFLPLPHDSVDSSPVVSRSVEGLHCAPAFLRQKLRVFNHVTIHVGYPESAIMAYGDVRARHSLEACRNIGCNVPDEVGVIGVGNDELICELAQPLLTSIEQGAGNVGYQAAASLGKLMSDKRINSIKQVIRATSGLHPMADIPRVNSFQ